MASAKLILQTNQTKKLKDGSFPIALQIIVNRGVKKYRIGYSSEIQYWDKNAGKLKSGKIKHPNYAAFAKLLHSISVRSMDIIMTLEVEMPGWSLVDFENIYFKKIPHGNSFIEFLDVYIDSLKNNSRVSDWSNFKSVRKNVIDFTGNEDLTFNDITIDWLLQLQQFFKVKGIIGRNILKDIRTLYNAAIRKGIAQKQDYPFGLWGIKLPRVKKQEKGLTIADVKKIMAYTTSNRDVMVAKKYWLFMFYCIGLEWKDLCLLKVSNVKSDRIEFDRSKTGRFFTIKLTPPALQIIADMQTGKKPGDYLFKIIPWYVSGKADREFHYAKLGRNRTNYRLKKIATALKIEKPITTKVARYTWASIARNELNVTTELIQDGLGHADIKVTQGYTNTRGNKEVDNLNDKMSKILL